MERIPKTLVWEKYNIHTYYEFSAYKYSANGY